MKNASIVDTISNLPDDTRLCSLAIPGTHDTMTSPCSLPYYRTQDLNLAQQLDHGVRYFDMRLRRSMVAAHREWISDITARSILRALREHLDANPRDFLLVRIQNANEAKDDFTEYGHALLDLISTNVDLFWTPRNSTCGTSWPTVGDIRGKIVAFECAPPHYDFTTVADRPWAAPWHNNDGILLQDDWDGPELRTKLSEIASLYHHDGDEDRLLINHVSATNGALGTPIAYAERANPRVLKMLHEPGRGVLIFDFINPTIINAVWDANSFSRS